MRERKSERERGRVREGGRRTSERTSPVTNDIRWEGRDQMERYINTRLITTTGRTGMDEDNETAPHITFAADKIKRRRKTVSLLDYIPHKAPDEMTSKRG